MTSSHAILKPLADWMIAAHKNRDSLPPHPAEAHREQISLTVTGSYYHRLNRDDELRDSLLTLFEDWSLAAALAFARDWRLPAKAIRDLEWSREWWLAGGKKRAVLSPGSRLFFGFEEGASVEKRRELGYVTWPPPLRDGALLARGAERLYLRAIEELPPEHIAAREKGIERRPADCSNVRKRTDFWAKMLGVKLPKRPRGRPRRKQSS